jgi:hypothetical protein
MSTISSYTTIFLITYLFVVWVYAPEIFLVIHRTFDKKVAVKIIKGNAQTGGV